MLHVRFSIRDNCLFYDGEKQDVHRHKDGYRVAVRRMNIGNNGFRSAFYIEATDKSLFCYIPADIIDDGFIVNKKLLPKELFNFLKLYFERTLK